MFLVLSTYCFIAGNAVMPIADALAIVFVEPFILLLLGYLLFGDAVGPRRIIASVIGFAGALLVIQPAFATFGYVTLFPLGTAMPISSSRLPISKPGVPFSTTIAEMPRLPRSGRVEA